MKSQIYYRKGCSMNTVKRSTVCIALFLASGIAFVGQQKRPISPSDCVTVRYLESENSNEPMPISISPDGTRVAYLVQSPNLATNENEIQLYVKRISENKSTEEKPIIVGDLSRLKWLGDSHSLSLLVKEQGKHVLKRIDADTGRSETLVQFSEDVDEYVSDLKGQVIVFAMTIPASTSWREVTQQEIASGYRIPFEGLANTAWPEKTIFVTRRTLKGWTTPERIDIESPFSHQRLSTIMSSDGPLWMSLSPNGKELLLQYMDLESHLPERWGKSPYVQYVKGLNTMLGQRVLALYHLDSGATTIPIETPFATSIPLWSADSRSFVVFAKPPVGSEWERKDAEGGPAVIDHGSTAQLFWVQPDDGKVELVATHEQASYPYSPPLVWSKDDRLLVGALDGTVTRFSHDGGRWVQGTSVKVPVDGFEYLVSDGDHVVGDMQSPTSPPALFIGRLGDSKVETFAKLNPQFDSLSPAAVKEVSWKTSAGMSVAGTLFLPPNYEEGGRYPLVIETKPYGKWFACDYGGSHFPSFAPQPLADAGIAYLGFYFPDDHDGKGLEDYYPQDYPGRIATEVFTADVYDTAVKALADRGLVDSKRVGIIGFSSSGYDVEFALVHGKTKYRAATVADNVEYSFSEYVMAPLIGEDTNAVSAMYGGPPSGSTLKNWTDYSISFNVDKVHTPLLMEEMGNKALFDRRESPPINITSHFGLFTELNLLHKPAEFYYYPTEVHQMDHPQARLANLQRNVDWYRFWLQGYERQNPEDPDQYKRWDHLRELRDADEKATFGQPPTQTITPN
jgi:dipeptidyl aminopeptidase/acylaminoacyl peptidase